MSSLQKIASKKKLIAALKSLRAKGAAKLYGKKPTSRASRTGAAYGATVGGLAGAGAGGIYGGKKSIDILLNGLLESHRGTGGLTSGALHSLYGAAIAPVVYGAGTAVGGLGGGTAGALAGAGLGRLIGKRIDKKRVAKYLANKKKINKRLTAGGGTVGIGSLLAANKRTRK